MIQTHLLKLEPPYQIIACRGEVGIQIATLIVTEETRGEDGKYGITTHSHPVVTYMDKAVASKRLAEPEENRIIYGDYIPPITENSEGVIWDKVECSETTLIGMTDMPNRTMTLRGFMEIADSLLMDLARNKNYDYGRNLVDLRLRLEDLGYAFEEPDEKEFTITLCVSDLVGRRESPLYLKTVHSFCPMTVPLTDTDKMKEWLEYIILQYLTIFGDELKFKFISAYDLEATHGLYENMFDPDHLTPEEQKCNEMAALLNQFKRPTCINHFEECGDKL